jgi:hypothetical protein
MAIELERSTRADRSAVWQVMSDLDRWDELPTIDEISRVDGSGPISVGTRFRVRQPGLAAAVYQVTDWEPGTGFTWEARTPGVRTVGTHTLRDGGDGTLIRLGIRWSGPGAGLARVLFAGKTRTYISRELDAFIARAEAQ